MDSESPPILDLSATLYIFHHVFLPPKLPQSNDYDPAHEVDLLDQVIDALHEFNEYTTRENSSLIGGLITAITRLRKIQHLSGAVDEKELLHALGELGTTGGHLPIYLREQNAGMILASHENGVYINSFELNPRNQAVITTLGRLQRVFPGPTLCLDTSTYSSPKFQQTLSQTLARMSGQSVADTLSKVKKAGQKHDEDRDTRHPKMVTEFLMATLQPRCTEVKTLQLKKNTRNEVFWKDCRSPWRRSALWLMVRVTLQIVVSAELIEGVPAVELSASLYKHFMVFLMARILHLSCPQLPAEKLYLMNAKIARRMLKLDLQDETVWLELIRQRVQKASDTVQATWKKIMKKKNSRPLLLGSYKISFDQDAYCKLPALDEYIRVATDQTIRQTPSSVAFTPQSNLIEHGPLDIPSQFKCSDISYMVYNLTSFEECIALNLDPWVKLHDADEATCDQLYKLMSTYHDAAHKEYSDNPEAMSIMILTILELWIACDKAVIANHPMLADYDPCVPSDIFQSLLVPFRSQMIRLARAEEYISKRVKSIKYQGPGIFEDFGTSYCFSVRHFAQSTHHQELLQRIEAWATSQRANKIQELSTKRNTYNVLMERVNQLECEHEEYYHHRSRTTKTRHKTSCERHRLQNQADNIHIAIHEWPLPTNQLKAQSTVFELNLPRAFGNWRDATIFFLQDVLGHEYSTRQQPVARYYLPSYSQLSQFFRSSIVGQRIGLLSEIKPHGNTHRKQKHINKATENNICLANGLQLRQFDSRLDCFVSSFKTSFAVARSCTYTLPNNMSSLQLFLFRPPSQPDGPSPNTVIATQSAAPDSMTLAEYRSLTNMPLGVEIQWQNLLLNLCASSVNLKKAETCIFIMQIINQAGPPQINSHLRKGHSILEDPVFANVILTEVEQTFVRLRENWDLVHGLNSLVFVVLRILAISPSVSIHEKCYASLRSLRQIAFDWVNLVKYQANQAFDDNRRTELSAKCVHISLVCTETFNTENLQLALENPSDISIFIRCCILIHDSNHIAASTSNPLHGISHHRWKKLTHRCRSLIAKKVVIEGNPGLDMAIKQSWAAYNVSPEWAKVSGQGNPWLVAHSLPCATNKEDVLVHFNLLTGELLVNGAPQGRLPKKYQQTKEFHALFGQSELDVMPSGEHGMQFSCQKPYFGYTVHLGCRSTLSTCTSELSVKIFNEEGAWIWIPPRLLTGSFPDAFVENCVHWYSTKRGDIEFRPATDPWKFDNCNWRLAKALDVGSWYLKADESCLISVDSPTARLISKVLSPIESTSNIHCILHPPTSDLIIELPRLRTSFNVPHGDCSLHCRQYPGMVIDVDQSLGSLIGLKSKLILREQKGKERMLLIPDGNVSCSAKNDHVKVQIDWQPKSRLHAFSIDNDLGRLVDNGTLESKLLLSYLHALTSFCLPDPLTGKTGTEESLSILRSAALRSFDYLRPSQISMLEKIAALTPQRRYYPRKERVMQSVIWQGQLGCLSQHNSFYREVAAIFEQDKHSRFLYPKSELLDGVLPCIDPDLLQRDEIRSSSFRTSGFGAEDHTYAHDRTYASLDAVRVSPQSIQVSSLCQMFYDDNPRIRKLEIGPTVDHLWQVLSDFGPVRKPDPCIEPSIRYDATFIADPTQFIVTHWCGIHRLSDQPRRDLSRFQLLIWLSTMAFSERADMTLLEIIASLFISPRVAGVDLPRLSRDCFDLNQGYEMYKGNIESRIGSTFLSNTPESRLNRSMYETQWAFEQRKDELLQAKRDSVLSVMTEHWIREWPTSSPSIPQSPLSGPCLMEYVDFGEAVKNVKELFDTRYHNREFRLYLTRILEILSNEDIYTPNLLSYSAPLRPCLPKEKRGFVTLQDLFGDLPAWDEAKPKLSGDLCLDKAPLSTEPTPNLLRLVHSLGLRANSKFEKWYIDQLRGSVMSLRRVEPQMRCGLNTIQTTIAISKYNRECEAYSKEIYEAILSSMSTFSPFVKQAKPANQVDPEAVSRITVLSTVMQTGQWPRISPFVLLSQLSHKNRECLSIEWRRKLVQYGCSLTTVQWARRLSTLVGIDDDLLKEIQNPGHTNWEPMEFPETLLLEVENGILVREVQEQIASQMRNFPAGANGALQLNMGEGKSSVITPIVIADFAKSSCLARVIVAKPQSRQMYHMLVSKLGGLLGRRVYQMPISRSLKFTQDQAERLYRICCDCMSNGGVLLVQPEHILSLKLMSIECFIVGNSQVGGCLLRTLKLFNSHSQDIVDESDENFSVKFELIYTMGVQRPVELSQQRWSSIQQVLSILRCFATVVKERFPDSIEVGKGSPGVFPRIRLLRQDAQDDMLRRIARHICDNGFGCLPISRQPQNVRQAVFTYLTKPLLTEAEIAAVEESDQGGFWTESISSPLLLLRGLLAGGVLAFCFGQKRWRVNYGSDPARTPPTRLSVPYRAKDSPSLRSEFSHPDVIIILTSLNYYYSGLNDDELFLAFEHLIKSDEPDVEYQSWVHDAVDLPAEYRSLVGINLDDRQSCTNSVFPALRFGKAVIDYFLSCLVFSRELREFPDKLSASGWDLGEIKKKPTVGFSGTNDSQKTLPLSVRQLHQPEQAHTNALVMEYLLQPENSVALVSEKHGCQSETEALLGLVSHLEPPVQVILDVGAQVLELSNIQMAQRWLNLLPTNGPIQGIIFIDENDDICVVNRGGLVELLHISPFVRQMDACYMFLDEAHTRGIDLKLPTSYRAAVTLGPGITKDKLVQACMRMRKLGKGQSVVFCIPVEIQAKILAASQITNAADITVSDVISWAIWETWIEIRRSMPLWSVQGRRFQHQRQIWHQNRDSAEFTQNQANGFLEPESQTLEERYRPGKDVSPVTFLASSEDSDLRLISARCQEFDDLQFSSSSLHEEQERELAPEIEREREVQRPPPADPAVHSVHPNLCKFVETGELPDPLPIPFIWAFQTMNDTSAAAFLDLTQFPRSLLVTEDFKATVKKPKGTRFTSDAFQRPVNWVLTSATRLSDITQSTVDRMILISPYEANALHSQIRKSKAVTLHQYSPRLTLGLRSLDTLELYSIPKTPGPIKIPDTLRVQLNLFSGQLYLNSYAEYQLVCAYLGVASVKTADNQVVAPDGFITDGNGKSSAFTKSPLKFLKVLMSQIRKDCQDISKTHIGKIVDGVLLTPSDFPENIL